MADPWPEYLAQFGVSLARPSRTWSEAEAAEVWCALATGRVGRALYATIRRKVRNESVAEELLQNLLAQLSIGRTYNPEDQGPQAFRTWIVACLHNHLCRYFDGETKQREALGRAVDIAEEVVAAEFTDKGRSARRVETEIDTQTLLDTLTPGRREIVKRNLRGETAEEIARELGLKPGNVRQVLFRTKDELRKRVLRKPDEF